MQKPFTVIFGGVIAYILLLLYAVTVGYMTLEIVNCGAVSSCDSTNFPGFSDGIVYVVTTIGGLVSALVVSKLAAAKPGENPVASAAGAKRGQIIAVNALGIGYLAVWLAVGLAALIIGVMLHPELDQTVSDIGTTWLGLAVASGYAYFGIDPS
ncbi:MAG: hypothetical protein ABFS14_04625 [Gemmatimonadota bacterium]